MTRLLTFGVLLLAAAASQASERRENCNQKGAGVNGSERNQIVAECIRRNAGITNMPPMLARMSQCNREAGNMAGEPRVRFVNSCLERPD